MPPLAEALAPWQGFYTLMGEASATMVGLLFVAASVGSGMFTRDRPGALRMFLSASVVQFGSVLAVALIVLAPLPGWAYAGGLVMACGAVGLCYCGLAHHAARRHGFWPKLDLDDRLWYGAAPALAFASVGGAGAVLLTGERLGCTMLALAMGALLLVAVHNAWDITVWSITRPRD
jgi:hypothetical protein